MATRRAASRWDRQAGTTGTSAIIPPIVFLIWPLLQRGGKTRPPPQYARPQPRRGVLLGQTSSYRLIHPAIWPKDSTCLLKSQ